MCKSRVSEDVKKVGIGVRYTVDTYFLSLQQPVIQFLVYNQRTHLSELFT